METLENCPVCGSYPVLVKITTESYSKDTRRAFKTISLHYECAGCCLVNAPGTIYMSGYGLRKSEDFAKHVRSIRSTKYYMNKRIAARKWNIKVNEIMSKQEEKNNG